MKSFNLKHSEQNNILIILAGPTAVGKTSCSLKIAEYYNADIFSSDSRQFFKEMTIGTAKPSKEEMQGIKHHFINNLSIHQHYDVGVYENDVISGLDSYYKSKSVAILTGGTGLYIKAVSDGLDKFPEVPESVKKTVINDLDEKGISFLQDELKTGDPIYFEKVDISNPHRLMRAISVMRSSKSPFSSFLNQKKSNRNFIPIFILLNRDRKELYERINLRVDLMIDQGLIEEAKSLYPNKNLKNLQTVGYQELFEHFDGKSSLDEAISLIKRNSRRYAKRQLTWFRKDERWNTFHPDNIQGIMNHIDMTIKPNTL